MTNYADNAVVYFDVRANKDGSDGGPKQLYDYRVRVVMFFCDDKHFYFFQKTTPSYTARWSRVHSGPNREFMGDLNDYFVAALYGTSLVTAADFGLRRTIPFNKILEGTVVSSQPGNIMFFTLPAKVAERVVTQVNGAPRPILDRVEYRLKKNGIAT